MSTGAFTPADAGDAAAPGLARTVAIALLLGLACYLTQHLSIALRFPPTRISTIWLTGGVVFGVLLVAPPRRWWILLPAAGAGEFAAYAGDVPLPARTAMVAVVYGLSAAVAGAARTCVGGQLRFDQARHVVAFLLAAIVLPVTGGLGVATVAITTGLREGFLRVWITLVLMAVLGLITVAPVIVVAATGGLSRLRSAPARWWAEAAALGLGVLGVSCAAFGGVASGPGLEVVWLLHAPLPVLLWAAKRFGPGGAGLALLTVALVSTANAANGRGPFAAHSPADNVLSLQLSVVAMGIPLLYLAAVMAERGRAVRALAASEGDARRRLAELAIVYQTAPIGLAFVDTDLRFVKVNDHLAEIDGRRASEHIGRSLRQALPTRLADELEAIYREVIAKGQPALDLEIRGTTAAQPGVERTWLASYFPVRDESGRVLGVNTVVREVTAERQSEERLRRSHDEVKDMAGRLIAAQEDERRRIARELHDDLTQRLAVLAIELGKMERRPDLAGPAAVKLGGVREQIVKLSEDVHSLSRRLHPSILDDLGLADALRSECAMFQEREGIEVSYRAADVPADLPRDVCLSLYRIAQEGLRNAVRHSGARRAEVSLTGCGADVLLTVGDDGKGFDRRARGGRTGIGLASMEERARLIGAELSIQSAPGKGTTVSVLVPRSEERS